MITRDRFMLTVVFLNTICVLAFAQKGRIEYPYEFQMFENFDLTKKVFVEEQKLVQKLKNIQIALKQSRDEIQVITFTLIQHF